MLENSLPILYGLGSACLFAFGAQFQSLGLTHLDTRTGTAISICGSAAFFWVLAPFYLNVDYFFHASALIFVVVGLFRPALSANLSVAGIRLLGPTLSSTLSSTSPLFGTAMGVLVLGEVLTLEIAVGTGAIFLAVLLLIKPGKVSRSWPIWAIALPIGAALIRSVAHILSKIGLNDIPDPFFAGLVGFTVSALVTIGIAKVKGQPVKVPWRSRGPAYFALAGVCFGVAILCMNNAFMMGKVTTVIPIIASTPIFTLLLSVVVFRREKLTGKTIAAVFLVVPAVVFIALSR